ncbi:MAG: hypothetical protein F6K61_00135 [Sphaerospermopsis sp. SIO1G1]|nr:hypothetical protein [Sphaerospermopsis sp. SIO1G1]
MTVLRHYERQRRNRKNPGIASLHCVSVAMTNLRCVSPDELRKRSRSVTLVIALPIA